MSGSSSGPPWDTADRQWRRSKPDWMLGPNDLGQVMVLVLRRPSTETEPQNSQKKQDAALPDSFIVGTSIELEIGVEEARKLNASREGRGSRYLLRTSSKTTIEKLRKITKLTDGTRIEIVPHPTLNTVQGVVYDPDSIDKDEQAIQKHLASQGVHTVRRIKKRVDGTPKKHSPQTEICLRCSLSHNVSEGERCENPPNCLHCNTGHAVTSRDCPRYKEEEKIVRIKIDQGISFTEARRLCNEGIRKETFRGVVHEQIQKEMAAKDQLISTLQKQVATLEKELATLKKELRTMPRSQSTASQPFSDSQQKASSQTIPLTSTPLDSSAQNITSRKSRKDKHFISPPAKQENRNSRKQGHAMNTRSRSGKRPVEIGWSATSS